MSRTRIALLSVIGVVPVALALWLAGFDISYQLGNYVISDDAVVTGDLIQASAPAGGQITDVLVDVGQSVEPGQSLATLAANATPGQPAGLARVRAPFGGTILALPVARGQSVEAGQPVAVLTDPDRLWITARVDETSFRSIRPNQRAEAYLPALDARFEGRVVEILPAAAGFVGAGGASASGQSSGAKAATLLPVRISFSYGDQPVVPGMTARVTIYIK